MSEILVVVDMQRDFINGSLGTKEAEGIVREVITTVENFKGEVIFTRDTHHEDYLKTQEGKNLPVVHCVEGTKGWQLEEHLQTYANRHECKIFDKPTFGSMELVQYLKRENEKEKIEKLTLIGLCTDICVISNAMLAKAALLDTLIMVKQSACAGVTVESHQNALAAMKMCQIEII